MGRPACRTGRGGNKVKNKAKARVKGRDKGRAKDKGKARTANKVVSKAARWGTVPLADREQESAARTAAGTATIRAVAALARSTTISIQATTRRAEVRRFNPTILLFP